MYVSLCLNPKKHEGKLLPAAAAWDISVPLELPGKNWVLRTPISETFNLKSIPFGVEYKHNSV